MSARGSVSLLDEDPGRGTEPSRRQANTPLRTPNSLEATSCGGIGHHIRRYLEISVRGSHSSFLKTRMEREHKGTDA